MPSLVQICLGHRKARGAIPKEIRDALGIEPGDETALKKGRLQHKKRTTTADENDTFEKERGSANSKETTTEQLHRLRGEQ